MNLNEATTQLISNKVLNETSPASLPLSDVGDVSDANVNCVNYFQCVSSTTCNVLLVPQDELLGKDVNNDNNNNNNNNNNNGDIADNTINENEDSNNSNNKVQSVSVKKKDNHEPPVTANVKSSGKSVSNKINISGDGDQVESKVEVRKLKKRLVNNSNLKEINKYIEVKDKRNYFKSKGGKSYGPFGRIIDESKRVLLINDNLKYKSSKRRFAVAMNCQRGNIPVENVLKKFHELISSKIFYRSALILGINEKVTMQNPINSLPTVEEVLSKENIAILKKLNIPVIVVYYQWTTYRDLETTERKKKEDNLTAQQVREDLFKLIDSDEELLQNVLDEDEEADHTFPFGAARTFLMSNDDSQKFVSSLHQNDYQVYIHIQDSDVISYQQNLMFTDFLLGKKPLIPRNIKHLLDKFDILIDHIEKQNGFPPLFVGGAHTYSPDEDLSDLKDERLKTLTSRIFTRLGSELSNVIRHFVGQQQPYGPYFHEPNCLILSLPSAKIMMKTHKNLNIKTAYERLALGFKFGNDSEMQEFTRKIFEGLDDDTCRRGMIFCATIVLATSMKRGNGKKKKGKKRNDEMNKEEKINKERKKERKNKETNEEEKRNGKPFTVEFDGEFDGAPRRFVDWTKNPLTSMNSMSQEIIHPDKWMSMIATSFTSHVKRDSRSLIENSMKLFTPDMTVSKLFKSPYSEEEQKTKASELFYWLTESYNEMVAFQILTLAWETGQLYRLVLSKHLTNQPTSEKDRNIIAFLSKRISYEEVGKNPFVQELLKVRFIPTTVIAREDKALKVAKYLMTVFEENKPKTAKALKIAPQTLNKLLLNATNMTARKRIAEQLDTEQNVRALLSEVSVSEEVILRILCLLGLRNRTPTTN
jgi:hypothetical protein